MPEVRFTQGIGVLIVEAHPLEKYRGDWRSLAGTVIEVGRPCRLVEQDQADADRNRYNLAHVRDLWARDH
ncbi:MAG: hypothetical protein AAFX81_06255 [Pseudomonadota bacterium]